MLQHDPMDDADDKILRMWQADWKVIPNFAPEAAVEDIIPNRHAWISRRSCVTNSHRFWRATECFKAIFIKYVKVLLDISALCIASLKSIANNLLATYMVLTHIRKGQMIGKIKLSEGNIIREFTCFITRPRKCWATGKVLAKRTLKEKVVRKVTTEQRYSLLDYILLGSEHGQKGYTQVLVANSFVKIKNLTRGNST